MKRTLLWLIITCGIMSTLMACSPNESNESDTLQDSGTVDTEEYQSIESVSDLDILVSDISETARYYPVVVNGTRLEVVVVAAADGSIRTAFNTCQVCNGSPLAYFKQMGDALQCQNCGNLFPMERVGIQAGGCNPVPIFPEDKIVTDETITIPYEVLAANAYRFPANWKTK